MKKFLLALLVPCLSLGAFAQQAFQAQAILSTKDGANSVAWILEASDRQIRYKTTEIATSSEIGNIANYSLIYLMEPTEYSEAMDLFEAGKFKEAKEKFAAYKELSKPTAALKGNFHTLSAFYEMECMRHLGDYAGLATALESFFKEPLSRDHHLRQLDLYVLWTAVQSESWDRLLILTSQRDDENLPGYQRAQVAFCKGLALQKKEGPQPLDALIEYGFAMTAASRVIAQDAALNSLQIYFEDAEVQAAMANWGTDDENKGSVGYGRLLEAAGLAKIYQSFLKLDKELSEDHAKFLKFNS